MLPTILLFASVALATQNCSKPLPQYAIDNMPLVHLATGERWWPSSVKTHLDNVVPQFKGNLINGAPKHLTTANLNFTSTDPSVAQADVYLTAFDDVEDDPRWLICKEGRPDSTGRSGSPAIIIAVDKSAIIGPGVVDVFYFMFYSYNHGRKAWGARYGNHVGDWEYVLIRYKNGSPTLAQMSQHDPEGQAFKFQGLEKYNSRPVFYAAEGTHSMYPKARKDHHGTWSDVTDAGLTWDLAANYNAYWYSKVDGFVPAEGTTEPGNYLSYVGHWGDKQYSRHDDRQHCIRHGHCHYIDGPRGPLSRGLLRRHLCEDDDRCYAHHHARHEPNHHDRA